MYQLISLNKLRRIIATEPWATPLSIAMGTRVAIYLLVLVFVGLSPAQDNHKPDFWQAISQWDGQWYLRVASEGYQWDGPTVQSTSGFLSLFPLLGWLVGSLLGDIHWGFLVVVNVSFVLYLCYLYRLVAMDFDPAVARRTLVYVAVFPAAFVFAAFYSEATSFALVVASLYYARRERWWWAIGLGALSTLSRLAGLIVLLPLAYEYIRQRGLQPQAAWLAVILAPLAAFFLYLWKLTGDPLAYLNVQRIAWFHTFTAPWETLRIGLERLTWPLAQYSTAVALLELGSILLFIALTLVVLKRMSPAYWLYSLATLLITLVQTVDPSKAPPTQSAPRYLMAAFPCFIALAQFGENPYIDQAVRWTFVVLMGVFALYFFGHFWVV